MTSLTFLAASALSGWPSGATIGSVAASQADHYAANDRSPWPSAPLEPFPNEYTAPRCVSSSEWGESKPIWRVLLPSVDGKGAGGLQS